MNPSIIDEQARIIDNRDKSTAPQGVYELDTSRSITGSMDEINRRPNDSKTTCGQDRSTGVRGDLQLINRPEQSTR